MIGNDAPLFGRMLTAMVTPFDDDGEVDYKASEKIADHLLTTGTTTILVSGTTGESPTTSDDEKIDLLKCVLSVAKGRAKVILGTGTNDTAKSIKLTQRAQREGAEGALVVAPYYNKPSQAGILAHVEKIASATTLPIIVYNIPGRTGVNITPDTMLRIMEKCENVHALKDSTGGVDQAAEISAHAHERFRIYSGDDILTLPYLSVGACGVVSVASHVAGEAISRMMAKFFSGDIDGARKLHYQYMHLFKGLFAAPNPTCVKYALSRIGLCKEHLRLPLVPLDETQKAQLDKILDEASVTSKLYYASSGS